jgi:SAM-dependent methyltransferase
MRRREFITLVGGAAAVWPITLRAQQGSVRIGFVPLGSPDNNYDRSLVESFRQGLRIAGLVEGRDVILDVIWSRGRPGGEAVSEALERGASLLVPCGSSASVEAKRQTSTIPITNCAFIAGDAYNIAKLAAPADFVFMANAFHGVPDRSRLAQAVGSALKADGYFAIVNWHKRPREETPILGEPRGPKTELRMSPEETIKSVTGRGLKFIKVVEIPPYHYGVMFQRS